LAKKKMTDATAITAMTSRYNSKRPICYGFLNNRVRYAIESATAKYPITVIKLAIVEAMKAW
jgi:hypothetical protein